MGDIDPDPEPEDRNSGLPPLPSVRSAFLEQGWSSRPPAGPSAPVAAAVPKAPQLPTPPPAFPPPNKTLAGLPLPPAVKWTPEVHNEAPSAAPPAVQPYRGEPRLPAPAAAPVAPTSPARVASAVPPPTAPAAVSLEAALFPGSRPPPLPSAPPSMQQVAAVSSSLGQVGSGQVGAFSQTAPMAAVVPATAAPTMGTAPMPAVPTPLVGPSVDVDDFARASKRGASGSLAAMFASKPRVAAVFFVLGVVATLGLQAIFGSDSAKSDATALSHDKLETAPAKSELAPAAKPEAKAADKVAEKVEPPPAPSAASAEPTEPAAAEDEPSSGAKSTKGSSTASSKFNKTAATKAMSAAASQASRCKTSGKGGPASVRVTFATSGKASLVQVMSGRFDSKTLGCIKNAFSAARVPAFTGKAEAVNKSFTVK